MAVNTKNAYGNISISDEAIACATAHIALDCYGVIDLVGMKSLKSSLKSRNKIYQKVLRLKQKKIESLLTFL